MIVLACLVTVLSSMPEAFQVEGFELGVILSLSDVGVVGCR